jgi:hypothetical protein
MLRSPEAAQPPNWQEQMMGTSANVSFISPFFSFPNHQPHSLPLALALLTWFPKRCVWSSGKQMPLVETLSGKNDPPLFTLNCRGSQ